MELCSKELQGPPSAFLWHRYLLDSNVGLGLSYRAFVAACTAGPIPAALGAPVAIGASEFGEAHQEHFNKVAETLKSLRRKTVAFLALPEVGGAKGAEFSKAQLENTWETMRLGHKYARKKRARPRFHPLLRAVPSQRGEAWGHHEHVRARACRHRPHEARD